jgi:hypothetical protein
VPDIYVIVISFYNLRHLYNNNNTQFSISSIIVISRGPSASISFRLSPHRATSRDVTTTVSYTILLGISVALEKKLNENRTTDLVRSII